MRPTSIPRQPGRLFLSVADVEGLLCDQHDRPIVERRTIVGWIDKKLLPVYEFARGKYAILPEDLYVFLESMRTAPSRGGKKDAATGATILRAVFTAGDKKPAAKTNKNLLPKY